MSVDAVAALNDALHYMNFLSSKIAANHNKARNALPDFESVLARDHERMAIEKAQTIVMGHSPGVTVTMTSTRNMNFVRPIPVHDYTMAIDSLYVDLKRAIVFSLKAVMVALGYVQASNDIKFESFLNHVTDGSTPQSRFSAALLAEPQAAGLVSFVRTYLAPLREVNAQRTTLEHFDLHYGGHHEVEMSWPEVTENVGPFAPHAISKGLTKKGVAMRDHLDAQVALVYDWMKLCGNLAATRALAAATTRTGATTGVA